MRRRFPQTPAATSVFVGSARRPGMRAGAIVAGVLLGAVLWLVVIVAAWFVMAVLGLERPALGASSSSTAIASVYTSSSAPGPMACTGRPVDDGARTFAALVVSCGSRVRFCYRARCVIATRTDSGPFVAGRSFDLTLATVRALGFAGLDFGVRPIRWEEI